MNTYVAGFLDSVVFSRSLWPRLLLSSGNFVFLLSRVRRAAMSLFLILSSNFPCSRLSDVFWSTFCITEPGANTSRRAFKFLFIQNFVYFFLASVLCVADSLKDFARFIFDDLRNQQGSAFRSLF